MTIPWIDRFAVMSLVSQGLTYRAVARQLRISSSQVGRIARQSGHDASASNVERAEDRALKQVRRKAPKGAFASMPAWVRAAGLAEDFRDHARDFGEHSAARHCRRLLAEVRRSA